MMEMKEYKVVVKNNEEAEEVRNLFELLGYKKESFHFNCYYPRSVVTQYRYEWLSTGHACDCENGEELTIQQLRDLVAQKQGLISGADALRALADGKEVERKLGIGWCNDVKKLSAETILNGVSELRIKPQTITLNIEIPAPFEPKDKDNGYVIDLVVSSNPWNESDPETYRVGAWRTEEEIKQVVAALRGALKNG